MKLTLPLIPFREAFRTVGRLCPARSPKVEIQSVLLTVGADGVITLKATDLAVWASTAIPGVLHAGVNMVLLPYSFVSQIAAVATKDLEFTLVGEQLTIESGKSKWTTPTRDPNLFPEFPTEGVPDGVAEIVIPANALAALIKSTVYAAGESSQWALGGCQVDWTPDRLKFTGADGRKISINEDDALIRGNAECPDATRSIPIKGVNFIADVLSGVDEQEDATVHFDKSRVHVRVSTFAIHCQLLEGRYPGIERVLPKFTREVVVAKAAILSAIRDARIAATDETRALLVAIGGGEVRIAASGQSNAATSFDLESEAEPFEFHADAGYLDDAIKAIDASAVAIKYADKKSAIGFFAGSHRNYVYPLNMGDVAQQKAEKEAEAERKAEEKTKRKGAAVAGVS